jgi:hypothetical protein
MSEEHNGPASACGYGKASQLDRRDFLKTTGVVVVGFSIAEKVAAQATGDGASGVPRGLVSGPPDPGQVDSYLAIHPDNTATLYTGYVELGQGGPTALRQVAAEELDLDLDQVKTVRVDTFVSTNGFTAASRTAAIGGTETRAAAAEARRVLLEMASEQLKTPVRDLTVTRGVVSVRNSPQRSVTYADLVGGKSFNRKFEQVAYNGGIELPRKSSDNAIQKRREDYRIVGTRVARPDIAEKVRGTFQYVQQVRVPGMLHGRVVWPSRTGCCWHQQSNGSRHRRNIGRRYSRRPDRSTPQLRRRGCGTRVECRPRREAVESHLGTVRVNPARPRDLVRQLQISEDQRPDRHEHRRC